MASYTLGERIKEKRESLGLSQQQLGDIFDPIVKRASISRWESGMSNPEIDKLPVLAKKFKTTIDYLITGELPSKKTTLETLSHYELFPNTEDALKKIDSLVCEGKINKKELHKADEDISTYIDLIVNKLIVSKSKSETEAQKTA